MSAFYSSLRQWLLCASMLAALMLIPDQTSAQICVGGKIAYSSDRASGQPAVSMLTVAPDMEYILNDQFSVGLELAYQHVNPGAGDAVWGLEATPFVRYTYYNINRVMLFADACVTYGLQSHAADSYQKAAELQHYFGAGVRPGFSYVLNEHFDLECTVGFFGVRQYDGYTSWSLGIDIADIAVGLTLKL